MISYAILKKDGKSNKKKTQSGVDKSREKLEQESLMEYNEGLKMMSENNYVEAKKNLRKSLDIYNKIINPSDLGKRVAFLSHKNMALVYIELKKIKRAIKEYMESTKLNETDLSVWLSIYQLSMGFMESDNGECDPKLAIYSLENILKQNPKNEFSIVKLLEIFFILGDEFTCSTYLPSAFEVAHDDTRIKAIQFLIENKKSYINYGNYENNMTLSAAEELVEDLFEVRRKMHEKTTVPYKDVESVREKLEDLDWDSLGTKLMEIYNEENGLEEKSFCKLITIVPGSKKSVNKKSSDKKEMKEEVVEKKEDDMVDEDKKDVQMNSAVKEDILSFDLISQNNNEKDNMDMVDDKNCEVEFKRGNDEKTNKMSLRNLLKKIKNEELYSNLKKKRKENLLKKKNIVKEIVNHKENVENWLIEYAQSSTIYQLLNSYVSSIFKLTGDVWDKKLKKTAEKVLSVLRNNNVEKFSVFESLYFAEFYLGLLKSKISCNKKASLRAIEKYLYDFQKLYAPSLLPYQFSENENIHQISTTEYLSKDMIVRYFWAKYNLSLENGDPNASNFFSICKNTFGENEIIVPHSSEGSISQVSFFTSKSKETTQIDKLMEEKKYNEVIQMIFDIFFVANDPNAEGREKFENVSLKTTDIPKSSLNLFRDLFVCFKKEKIYFCMYICIDWLVEHAICNSPEIKEGKLKEQKLLYYLGKIKKYYEEAKYIFQTPQGKELLVSLSSKLYFVLRKCENEEDFRTLYLLGWSVFMDLSVHMGLEFMETSKMVFMLYDLFLKYNLKTEQKFQISKLYLTYFQKLSEEQKVQVEKECSLDLSKELFDCIKTLIQSKIILFKSKTSNYMSAKKLEESSEIFRVFYSYMENKEKTPQFYDLLTKFYNYFKIPVKLAVFRKFLTKAGQIAPPLQYHIKVEPNDNVKYANEHLFYAFSSYLFNSKFSRTIEPSPLKSAFNKDRLKDKTLEDAIMCDLFANPNRADSWYNLGCHFKHFFELNIVNSEKVNKKEFTDLISKTILCFNLSLSNDLKDGDKLAYVYQQLAHLYYSKQSIMREENKNFFKNASDNLLLLLQKFSHKVHWTDYYLMAKVSKKLNESPEKYLDYYDSALKICNNEYMYIPKHKLTSSALKVLRDESVTNNKFLMKYFPNFTEHKLSSDVLAPHNKKNKMGIDHFEGDIPSFFNSNENSPAISFSSDNFRHNNIYSIEESFFGPLDLDEKNRLLDIIEKEFFSICIYLDKNCVHYHKSIFSYAKMLNQNNKNCLGALLSLFELENLLPERITKSRKFIFKDEGPSITFLDKLGFDFNTKQLYYTHKYFSFLFEIVEGCKDISLLRSIYQRLYMQSYYIKDEIYTNLLEKFERIFSDLVKENLSHMENTKDNGIVIGILLDCFILYNNTASKKLELLKERSEMLETVYKYSVSLKPQGETDNTLNFEQIKEDCKQIFSEKAKQLGFRYSSDSNSTRTTPVVIAPFTSFNIYNNNNDNNKKTSNTTKTTNNKTNKSKTANSKNNTNKNTKTNNKTTNKANDNKNISSNNSLSNNLVVENNNIENNNNNNGNMNVMNTGDDNPIDNLNNLNLFNMNNNDDFIINEFNNFNNNNDNNNINNINIDDNYHNSNNNSLNDINNINNLNNLNNINVNEETVVPHQMLAMPTSPTFTPAVPKKVAPPTKKATKKTKEKQVQTALKTSDKQTVKKVVPLKNLPPPLKLPEKVAPTTTKANVVEKSVKVVEKAPKKVKEKEPKKETKKTEVKKKTEKTSKKKSSPVKNSSPPSSQSTPTKSAPPKNITVKSDELKTKKKRKRSPKPTVKSSEKDYIVPKEIDENNIKFPLHISNTLVVESLGYIPDNPENFNKPSFIYPVGYQSYKVFKSYLKPNAKTKYHSSILLVDGHPKFQLIVEDDPKNSPYLGDSPSNVWSAAFSHFEKKTACSGPDNFGLGNAFIKKLIQELPGSEKCTKYTFINFQRKEKVKKSKKNGHSSDDNETLVNPKKIPPKKLKLVHKDDSLHNDEENYMIHMNTSLNDVNIDPFYKNNAPEEFSNFTINDDIISQSLPNITLDNEDDMMYDERVYEDEHSNPFGFSETDYNNIDFDGN